MMKDGALTFTQHKNRNREPVTLTLPVSEEMRAVLEALPEDRRTFLVNEYDRPFASTAAFGNRFRDWCREAGLHDRAAHGLRKHFAATLAEHGASDREIMSMTGHRTSKEVDRYTRSASQKCLATAARQKLTRKGLSHRLRRSPKVKRQHSLSLCRIRHIPEGMVPRRVMRVIICCQIHPMTCGQNMTL